MSRTVFPLWLIVALLLSGCYQVAPGASQNDNVPSTPTRLPNLRPANTIVVDGSAIVGGIIQNISIGFEAFTPGYKVEMGAAGTRDGFKLFCDDQTDIQAAVRAMDASESADCTRNGVDFIRLTIAFDALAVIGDAPVQDCISASELAYVYTHDIPALTWQDVRTGLPAVPVKVFAPTADTAAAQFFAERVLNGKKSVQAGTLQGLIVDGSGIGYLPLVEAEKLGGRLKLLAVNAGSGCITPTEQTIWDGSYSLLSRPLYIYINRASLRRSEVFRFVTYTLSVPGQQHTRDAGFIPASPQTYADAQAQIDRATRP